MSNIDFHEEGKRKIDFWSVIGKSEALREIIWKLVGKRPWAILPLGSQRYVYEEREKFCNYCMELRKIKKGESICLKSDDAAAKRVSDSKQPDIYLCDAGLCDIAVPIVTSDNTCIATLFTGQKRHWDTVLDKKGRLIVQQLEDELKITSGQLTGFYDATPQNTPEEIAKTVENLIPIAKYLGEEWGHRVDYQSHLNEHKAAEEIRNEVQQSKTPGDFINRAAQSLEPVCNILGCNRILLLMPSRPGTPKCYKIRGSYGIPRGSATERPDEFGIDDPIVDIVRRSTQNDVNEIDSSLNSVIVKTVYDGNSRDSIFIASADIGEHEHLPLLLIVSIFVLPWQVEPLKRAIGVLAREYAIGFKACREISNKSAFALAVTHEMVGPARAISAIGTTLAKNPGKISPDKALKRLEELDSLTELIMRRAMSFQVAAELTKVELGDLTIIPIRNVKPIEESDKSYSEMRSGRDFISILMQAVRCYQALKPPDEFQINFASFDKMESITADVSLLEHMLMNLIDNAVKYSISGSQITIYGGMTNDGIRVIGIRNEGIKFEQIDQAFQLYHRGENAARVNPAGTGIGLALVKSYAELHGWKIEVHQSQISGPNWRVSAELHIGKNAILRKSRTTKDA